MADEEEEPLIRRVVERLAASYPETPRDHIEGVVADEYALLERGRIRNYIPILVERRAWNRLHLENSRRPPHH